MKNTVLFDESYLVQGIKSIEENRKVFVQGGQRYRERQVFS